MAKKQTEIKNQPKKSRKKKILFIFILLLFLSIIISGLITWYIYFEKDRFRPRSYNYFEFPAKTQIFFNKNYPQIISIADSIENELAIIEKESQRILNMEKEYPDQKNITEKAIEKLNKIQADAKGEMSKIINQLNSIFVTANLGSSSFEESFREETKKAEEKLNLVNNKIINESAPYKSPEKKPQGLIEKIKSYL
ncbi:MAG: hypothetical protein H6680_02460 [Desulfobacteraceae bacterium]|nr:hypothetical protein [Desulfobacteraceae bacterium]